MRTAERRWVGLDGEGVGRKPHRYVLLARSDTDGVSDYIENRFGLSSEQCLDFLVRSPTDARLCGYYLGYDWTMILRDLPNKKIYRLLRPETRVLPRDEGGGFSRIHWKGFRLHFLSGMMRIQKGPRSVTIWDLGKFFQCSFVQSLEDWGVGLDVQSAIAEMKSQREGFQWSDMPRIRQYCFSECRSLAQLATELQRAHDACNLRPQSWHGPGSTASKALTRLGIKEKRGKIPRDVENAASCAFFGGRFEHSGIGRYKQVYGYDIVSAYPFAAYNLPCLEHATWERVEREPKRDEIALIYYRLSDVGDEPWAPLPCRLENGSIVYPRSGAKGWIWAQEYWMGKKHFDGVHFGGKAWMLHSDCDCQPFAKILEWFRERVKLGKSQRGRVLKLALNSIYGKLAQTVGVPKFASRVWAGMITSTTRAQLLDLLVKHPRRSDVIALATDGLYSRRKLELPAAPLKPDLLGSWEGPDDHGPMVFVRPGIYWSEKDDTLRARGVGRKHLEKHRELVMKAIAEKRERAILGSSVLFGGARACVYQVQDDLKRSTLYGEWHDVPARISLDPAPKRNPDWSLRRLDNVESYPYSSKRVSKDARMLKAIGDILWASR